MRSDLYLNRNHIGRMWIGCFFLATMFVFCFQAEAQIQVKGRVLERGTQKPLSGVNVFVLPEGLKATSNPRGEFSFENIPVGEREWIVTIAGYKRVKRNFTYSQSTDNIIIYVERNTYVDFETTVIGKKEKVEPAKTTLKQSDFLTLPGSAGDPVRALENLPGVLQSFDANVAIQGSPPEDTKYLIEGHEIPFIFHFFGLNTVAVPETVESIDFLTAGYGPEYGRASSGIIDLSLRKPRTDRIFGMSYVDFTATGGFLEGPLNKEKTQSFFVGGRYSYVGQVIKAVSEQIQDDEEDAPPTFNTAPTYWDINFTYLNELTEKLDLRLITIASQDRVEAIVEGADNPTFSRRVFGTTDFFRVIPKLSYRLKKNVDLSTSIGVGIDHNQFEPGEQSLEITNTRVSWRSQYADKSLDWYQYSVGTDFIFEESKIETRIAQSFFSRDDVNPPFEISELLIANQKFSDLQQGYYFRNDFYLLSSRLRISPNLRYDYYRLHKTGALQPRFGVSYKITQNSNIYFNTGSYFQPETAFNLSADTGNPQLDPSRSIHYSIRYEHDFREGQEDGLQVSGGLFLKDLRDLIADSSRLVLRDGASVPERYDNSGKGEVKGLEFLIRYKDGRKKLNVGYTFTESTREDPETGETFPSEQDQTHNINITGSYSWGNYNLGVRFRFVSGLPFTPLVGGIYYENSDIYLPIEGDKLSSRVGDFWQLDARLDRKWIYDTWILSLYLDIQNITNRENPAGNTYSFDFSERENTMGLPILPTFGVKGEF